MGGALLYQMPCAVFVCLTCSMVVAASRMHSSEFSITGFLRLITKSRYVAGASHKACYQPLEDRAATETLLGELRPGLQDKQVCTLCCWLATLRFE